MTHLSREELLALQERSDHEWDNGTFLGPEGERPAAWVRSAILVADQKSIMSDHMSHSLGILAEVVLKVKVLLDDLDMYAIDTLLGDLAAERLQELRELVDW